MGYSFGYDSTYTISSYTYGGWRTGPTGMGPCTLSINESTSINRSFTSSISGLFPVGIGTIGSALGVTIGETMQFGTSYSLQIASGQRKTIVYRPKIKVVKVVQKFYQKDTLTGEKTYLSTSTAYVNVFNSWDYKWIIA